MIKLFAILGFLVGCQHTQQMSHLPTAQEIETETLRINDFFDRVFERDLERSPQSLTEFGRKAKYSELDDISLRRMKEDYELSVRTLQDLRRFDYSMLSPVAQVSYKVFERDLERSIEGFQWKSYRYAISQMRGLHTWFPSFMMNYHKIDSLPDAEAYVTRLRSVKPQFESLIEKLKLTESNGVIPPQFVYPQIKESIDQILKGRPFTAESKYDSPLLADFKGKVAKISITPDQRRHLITEAERALTLIVKPSYDLLSAELERLQKMAPMEGSLSYMPKGQKLYNFSLQSFTTTKLTADEIHQVGLQEVQRIHQEIEILKAKMGYKGTLLEFMESLKTDKKYQYPNTAKGREQYLTSTRQMIANMKSQLKKMFNILPKAEVVVKRVEPFREKSSGLAFYESPSEDGTRPGVYYLNMSDMAAVNKFEAEALAYHEAVPGHHMQLAIANELVNLPKFRKYNYVGAYVEGWGLYAEDFPIEFGFYKSDASKLGRLTMDLWRAARLVVDTGLHAKKWTYLQSVEWLDKNTPSTRAENMKAVERYTMWPGQATSYMVGKLKLKELRKKAEQKLGEKFDIRDFHDEILRNGAVPLDILELIIDQWIAKKSA